MANEYYYCLSFILDHTGLLDDSYQIIEFLTPAKAQCKALAQQFDLNPDALSNASTDPFYIMLDKLLNTKHAYNYIKLLYMTLCIINIMLNL